MGTGIGGGKKSRGKEKEMAEEKKKRRTVWGASLKILGAD